MKSLVFKSTSTFFAVLLFSLIAGGTEIIPKKPFIGYMQSYDDDCDECEGDDSHRDPLNSMFARVQPGINMVDIAFLEPDYSGNPEGKVNGLPYSKNFLTRAVAWFHKERPGIPVLISVGGGGDGTAPVVEQWNNFNAGAIANLVRDTGLDGVEIDYELPEVQCGKLKGLFNKSITCTSDKQLVDIIHNLRVEMPRPAILSFGAYGYAASSFDLSVPYEGMAINLVKHAGQDLDMIEIMGYGGDMGRFNAKYAFLAFRKIFPGKIALGISCPQDRDRPFRNLRQMTNLAAFIKNQEEAGMMLWNLQSEGWSHRYSLTHPSADMIIRAVCKLLGTEGCPMGSSP